MRREKGAGRLVLAVLLLVGSAARADWQYTTQDDKMTGKPTQHAILESNNSLNLPFPYSGQNNGRLYIRRHPKSGLNVIVRVDKGQILCSSFDSCSVMVRFDNAQPIRVPAVGSGDHDSTVIFLENEARFVAAAKKASKILVQFTMYQAGEQVLEFHSSKPLEWAGK